MGSDDVKNEIISNNGSIQAVACIPDNIKKLYKTVWEISQKVVLKQAADRGAFIDQSQSLNVHIAEPNFGKMSSCTSMAGSWVSRPGCTTSGPSQLHKPFSLPWIRPRSRMLLLAKLKRTW